MSNSIVLTKEGVTVQKELVREGLPMPAIRFSIESDRSVPVALRMTDTLPSGVTVEDIGFHEDYEKEHWRSDGGHRLAYERVIGAGERTITVYFVREDDLEAEAEGFESPPAIEQVQPVDADTPSLEAPLFRGSGADETPVEGSAAVSADVTGVTEPSTPSPGVGQRNGTDPSTSEPLEEPIELNDPDEPAGSADVMNDAEAEAQAEIDEKSVPEDEWDEQDAGHEPLEATDVRAAVESALDDRLPDLESTVSTAVANHFENRFGDASSLEAYIEDLVDERLDRALEDRPSETAMTESLLDRLAEEVATGADTEAVETLEAALSPDVPNHVTVRLERIESEVNELSAYTDALKAFIDEEGTARQRLEDLDGRMDRLEADNTSLSQTTTDLQRRLEDLEALESAVASLASDLEAAVEDLQTHAERIDANEDTIEAIESDLGALRDRSHTLDDRLADVTEAHESIEARFEALSRALSDPFGDAPVPDDEG